MTVQEYLELNEASIGSSGASWDSCEALVQLNKARSALYGLHNFHGLLQTICVNTCNAICLPWFADSIKAAYRCNKLITIASGEYFAYINNDCCGQPEGITDTGEYLPVPCSNSFCTRIGVRSADFNDNGKKVSITYVATSGSLVTDEFVLNFEGFSVTELAVARIVSIKKDSTNGIVWFHDVNNEEALCNKLFCAYPLETNLRYRKYCVSSQCCSSCSQIALVVRRKFIPFTDMHYNMPIDFAEHALSLAMEAIAAKDKRTPEGVKMYNELIRSAINYLKLNTVKEEQTFSDVTLSQDYPSINECAGY